MAYLTLAAGLLAYAWAIGVMTRFLSLTDRSPTP